jgi:glycosyltransferase involved in cell wall biosynthesis
LKDVSVVITAYNEEEYLPRCLLALSKQTFPKDRFEVIVVDNNSTDKTAEIAKSYGATVIKEEKQGNTFALKRGLLEAKGEIIASTDADTVVSNRWVEVIYNAFLDPKVVAATGPADIETKNKAFYIFARNFYDVFVKFHILIGKSAITGFNFAVRKKTLEEIGGVDEKFTMSPDVDLGIRMGKKGKVIFLKDMVALTSYRRWQENPSKTFWTYFKGYLWSIWFRKPPPVKQNVVR